MFIIVRVSSNTELIIRRSKCINTASGIVWSLTESTIPDAVLIQFDLLMMSTVLLETCRLRRNQFLLNLHTGQLLTEGTIPDAVLIQFDLLMMSTVLLETRGGLQ
jgi:hypothetical protein